MTVGRSGPLPDGPPGFSPPRRRLSLAEHQYLAAERRLFLTELRAVQTLHDLNEARWRRARPEPGPVDADELADRQWAQHMIDNPRHYPDCQRLPFEEVYAIVRSWRSCKAPPNSAYDPDRPGMALRGDPCRSCGEVHLQ